MPNESLHRRVPQHEQLFFDQLGVVAPLELHLALDPVPHAREDVSVQVRVERLLLQRPSATRREPLRWQTARRQARKVREVCKQARKVRGVCRQSRKVRGVLRAVLGELLKGAGQVPQHRFVEMAPARDAPRRQAPEERDTRASEAATLSLTDALW